MWYIFWKQRWKPYNILAYHSQLIYFNIIYSLYRKDYLLLKYINFTIIVNVGMTWNYKTIYLHYSQSNIDSIHSSMVTAFHRISREGVLNVYQIYSLFKNNIIQLSMFLPFQCKVFIFLQLFLFAAGLLTSSFLIKIAQTVSPIYDYLANKEEAETILI